MSKVREWRGESGQHWAEHADRYDRAMTAYLDALLDTAAAKPGERVVDIGCGNGATTLAFADAVGGDGSVLGVDISPPMLDVARRRASGRSNVAFLEADASTHGFEPDADLLCSRFGVMFFDEPQAAFMNLATALVGGGRLAILVWQALGANPWMSVQIQAVASVVPLPPPADPTQPGPFSLGDPDRIREVLSSFDDVSIDGFVAPLWLGPDAADAAAFFSERTSAKELFAQASPQQTAEAIEALRDALSAYEGPDGVWLDGAAWLVTARRR